MEAFFNFEYSSPLRILQLFPRQINGRFRQSKFFAYFVPKTYLVWEWNFSPFFKMGFW